ncbi:cupin domain-containing protein [Selenomonas sputigena]|uniref:cupin domain-containing protein n=1 Tax=Selenomonas sputigena TaxID=69823 RepID=UPI00222E54E3|nr:cupin domain-containing protein [Selenomonas sputigena]UZD43605.1 cupin domain-containing protein [Selenomonas sputigena]
MRYGRAVVWLLTGILAGMSPTVQTVEAAEAAAQSKPPASSAAQGADGKTNTAGTAMDEAAWEAALAAGATVSAVHGTVTPDPAAAQAVPDATPDATLDANAGAAQAERPAESPTANEKSDAAQAALTPDGGAEMQQVQPVQQMQQESAVVQMTPPEVQAAKTTAVPNAAARVQEIMQKFRLSGNPRSGAYSWVYTSPTWTAEAISRPAAGSSYFLLAGSENLRFQSFDCDEVWYFHEGCGMRLTVLAADGTVRTFELGVGGAAMPMVLIPKGQIFAAENIDSAGYSFISCMTIPALETAGIRVWQREELLAKYPQAKEAIEHYTDAPWGAARTQETAQAGGDIHG